MARIPTAIPFNCPAADVKISSVQTLSFKSPAEFRRWLSKHHTREQGIWLRFFRKASGIKTVTYLEALDQALCRGWIDGQAKPCDEQSWIQRFTPRRAKSGWSKRNTLHAERLIQAGQMTAPGLAAIEAAKADGRWHAAYDSPSMAEPPEDFLRRLAKHKKAEAFFKTLNRANIYAIVYRLQTAKKPETRERRMAMILGMLKQRKAFHPQRAARTASRRNSNFK